MKILSVVGARPNFMKVAPLHRVFAQSDIPIQSIIVHTGQHFDEKMSHIFFEELALPKPDYFLGVGQGTHTELTARIMLAFEPILIQEKPDLVIVVGDVTSTFACALVAQRLGIPLAHVEAGLRSFDRKMPEEVNRILTDQISDFLFITEDSAKTNLVSENIPEEKIFFVGNCMIDSLAYYEKTSSNIALLKRWDLDKKKYVILTMHRPSNVDNQEGLLKILSIIQQIDTEDLKIVFPLHPRTKQKIIDFGMWDSFINCSHLILTEPLGYLEFVNLMRYSLLAITDSGGIQEETTYLNIPCITFRKTTERPVTVEVGSNTLISDLNTEPVIQLLHQIKNQQYKISEIPKLWDGKAAERILETILLKLND
ncbi:MAG: UDP-N-acetylglucosamine 2-epimerase (non-hydrolyzing) [Saprospiraceae bacterium]|nr:UDP-N-acetylglucosamine 2-epimerase (non-hydrolyzing) [Saprospiraceae bacterium]